jgi:hypothetical protein
MQLPLPRLNRSNRLNRLTRVARPILAATIAGAALSACYVVPLGQPLSATPQVQAVTPVPAPPTFSARLYPANAAASRYGTINATVTSDLNGRGHLSAQIDGEQFHGEATRAANSRNGVANASGNRGGVLSCSYTMNASNLGSGQCVLNNGPQFAIHIGG